MAIINQFSNFLSLYSPFCFGKVENFCLMENVSSTAKTGNIFRHSSSVFPSPLWNDCGCVSCQSDFSYGPHWRRGRQINAVWHVSVAGPRNVACLAAAVNSIAATWQCNKTKNARLFEGKCNRTQTLHSTQFEFAPPNKQLQRCHGATLTLPLPMADLVGLCMSLCVCLWHDSGCHCLIRIYNCTMCDGLFAIWSLVALTLDFSFVGLVRRAQA